MNKKLNILLLFLLIPLSILSQCSRAYYATTFEDPLRMCGDWSISNNSYITYDSPNYYIKIEGDLILNNYTFGARGVNIEVMGDVIGESNSELWAGTDGFICVNGTISPEVNINTQGGSIFDDCLNYEVDPTLSINDSNQVDYIIYPNPTKDEFFIKPDLHNIKIYDVNGIYLTDKPNLSQFPNGIYIVKIQIESKTINRKLIKF